MGCIAQDLDFVLRQIAIGIDDRKSISIGAVVGSLSDECQLVDSRCALSRIEHDPDFLFGWAIAKADMGRAKSFFGGQRNSQPRDTSALELEIDAPSVFEILNRRRFEGASKFWRLAIDAIDDGFLS